MKAAPWVGVYALALFMACGPDVPPTEPTGGPGPKPEPTEPECSLGKLSEAYLAADARLRNAVAERRKIGVIPVKLEVKGCDVSLEVLENCNMPGFYVYNPYSSKESKVVRSKDDLVAELPVGAKSLAHKLNAGIIRADQMNVGVFQTDPSSKYPKQNLQGGSECTEATHYISKIYVGGFAMANGPAADLDKEDTVFKDGVRSVFAMEGQPSACSGASSTREPNELCSVPLKIVLSNFTPPNPKECVHDPCEPGKALANKCTPCVEAVCGEVEYCCKSHWDQACIDKAKKLCSSPCTGCQHNLCEQGDKLDAGCDDCAQKVCAADGYCCSNKWDTSCVSKVVSMCNKTCEGAVGYCTGGQSWNASTKTCECPYGQTWNGSNCITPASCSHDKCISGGPLLSSCDSCTEKVCNADAYCCGNNWDSTCVAKVKSVCNETCPCDKYGTAGKCEGKVLKYCISGELKSVDCSQSFGPNKFCGYDPGSKYYACVAKSGPGPAVCKQVGQPCSSNSQCCNFSCQGGKCQQPQ